MSVNREQATLIAWVAPLVGLSVLWGGTVDRPATMVVAGLAGLLAIGRGLLPKRVPVSLFSVWLLCAAVVTALQCVPIPPSLRGVLALGSDLRLRQALGDLGGYPMESFPLSVDPAETIHEATRLLGALCLLCAWSTLRSRSGDSLRLAGLVVCSAVLVALLGALAAIGIKLPTPLAVSATGASRALWPAVLQNANHMAALLSVGAILSVGMMLQTDPQRRRQRMVTFMLSLLLLNLALLMTLSRAGILCGLLGQLLVLLLADSPDLPTRRLRLWQMVLPSLLLCLVLLWLGPGTKLIDRFREGLYGDLLSPGSKLWVWRESLPLWREHLWLGIGRGALETALQVSPERAVQTRFTYLENEWLQTLLDYGIVAGLTLIALLCGAMWQSLRQLGQRKPHPPSPVRRAALFALIALGLHNLFDFNLAIGALAIPALLLATLVQKPIGSISARWLIGPGLATMILALWVQQRIPSHDADGSQLQQLASDPRTDSALLLQTASQALRRHPLDSYLSAVVAARLTEDRHPEAMRWINRALLQNPSDLLARATAARLLGRHGHTRQALSMLGPLIGDADPEKRRWLLGLLLELSAEPAELLRELPNRSDVRLALLNDLGTRPPPRWPLILTIARESVKRGDSAAWPWFGRAALAESRADDAETALRGLLLHDSAEPLLIGGLLELLLRHKLLTVAAPLAEQAIARLPTPEVRIAHAQILAALGQVDAARQTLQMGMADCHDLSLLARLHEVRAEVEQQVGQSHRAAVERAEATRLRREAK